jgi:hypothetical protein
MSDLLGALDRNATRLGVFEGALDCYWEARITGPMDHGEVLQATWRVFTTGVHGMPNLDDEWIGDEGSDEGSEHEWSDDEGSEREWSDDEWRQ